MAGAAIVGLLLIASGCGGADGPKRNPVNGAVKFKGEPVASGTITFGPSDAKGTAESATIANGAYKIERGLAAGDYVITVEGYKESPREADSKKGGAAPDNSGLPKKYATAKTTDLKATIADGPQVKDFDLKD
jgi:hypothetical protein